MRNLTRRGVVATGVLAMLLVVAGCASVQGGIDPEVDLNDEWGTISPGEPEYRAATGVGIDEVLERFGPLTTSPDTVECAWAVAVEASPLSVMDLRPGSIAVGHDSGEAPKYVIEMKRFASADDATEFRTQITNAVGSCPSTEVAGDGYSSTYTFDSLVDHGDYVTWARTENARIGFAAFTSGSLLIVVRSVDEIDDAQLSADVKQMVTATSGDAAPAG